MISNKTVKSYCKDYTKIENYEKAIADKTQTWDCHHRMEKYFPQKTLIAIGWYYDCEPEELIFLTPTEHRKIDSFCKRTSEARKGKKRSEEAKQKISETMKNHKVHSKKVLCVETGDVFESTMDAYRKTGISHCNISGACNGKRKTAGDYHWKYV